MRHVSWFLLAAGLLALAGCASTPARVDHGPIRAATFSFVKRGPAPLPGYADDRQPIHSMIQAAISRNLAARGVNRVDAGGDVTVGYLVIVGNNASTEAINDYFGYGEDASDLLDKAHTAYTGKETASYFEAGTLVVDIVDSKTAKLLKRSYATRPVLRNAPDDVRATRIQQVVDDVLGDLRVVP